MGSSYLQLRNYPDQLTLATVSKNEIFMFSGGFWYFCPHKNTEPIFFHRFIIGQNKNTLSVSRSTKFHQTKNQSGGWIVAYVNRSIRNRNLHPIPDPCFFLFNQHHFSGDGLSI